MNFKMQSLTDVWKESKLYVMGFVALLGITIGTAFTYQNVIKPLSSTVSISSVKADDDDGSASYSFYDMSAWLSAYYNAATSPTGYQTLEKGDGDQKGKALLTDTAVNGAKEAGEEDWALATPTWVSSKKVGGGGSLLGFPDQNVVKGGIFGFLSSKTSSSTTDYSYTSLSTRKLEENKQYYNSLESYAYYGASLQALGIDSSMGGGIMGWHPIRMLGGAIIWIFYIIVSFVEKIFAIAIAILQVTNPFKWFATAMSYTWITADSGPLAGLTNLVSSTYKIFSNFGWVIMIPIIISSLIFMLIFTGGGRQNPNLDQKRRNKFRYGLIYFFFLAVGVPFLGTAYTAGLDAMSASFGTGFGQNSFSADSVILSTYVYNKPWIEENRMYLPKDSVVEWDLEDNDVTASSKAAVRQTALAINALNNNAAYVASTATQKSNWNLTTSSTTNNVSKSISAMLLSYMMGDVYEPSNWETNVKAELTRLSNDDAKITNDITSGALELTKGYKYLGYVNANVDGDTNAGVEVKDSWWPFAGKRNVGGTINMFLNKGFPDQGAGGIRAQYDGSNIVRLYSYSGASEKPNFDLPTKSPAVMSYLEMYNYLNSNFTSNKVRVYSTNALASNFSRESHAAVNQVGSGLLHKFLIWVNTTVMLMGLGILAIGYAFGMLIGAFRRYWTVISAVFTGTLGMQKGMVQAIAGTVMLIAETLGTLVIYELVKTFYIGIPSVLEGAFASVGTSGISGTALMDLGFGTASTNFFGFILIIFALIMSTILLAWSTLMLLRIRKPILDIMDTTFTGLINKLFYGDGNVPNDAPKGVNPGESGGMNSAVGAVGGVIAGALGSNVDGADGTDGGNGAGWNDSGSETVANGDASSSSGMDDGDGPDARVAASRDTEETGAEVGEQGKLDRSGQLGSGLASSENESEDDVSEAGSFVGGANQNVGESEDGIDDVASSLSGVNAPVSATSSGSQGSDQSSDVSASESSPTFNSDDDTVSVDAIQSSATSSPSGGLSPDADNESISESSPVKSSVEDNDTVQASNVVSMSEGAKRLAEKRGQGTENAQGVQGNESELTSVAQADTGKVAPVQNGEQEAIGKQLQQRNTNGVGVGESNRVSQSQAQRRTRNAVNRVGAEGTENAQGVQGNESELTSGAQADAEKVVSGQNGKQDISDKQLEQHNTNGVGIGESNRVAQSQSESQRRTRNAVDRVGAEGAENAQGVQGNESELMSGAQADTEKVAVSQNGKQDISDKQLQQHNTNGVGIGESNRVAQSQSESQRRTRNAVDRVGAEGTDAGTQALDPVQQGGGTGFGEHAVQTATPSVGDSKVGDFKANSSGVTAQQSAPVNPVKRLAQATVNATLAGAGLQERNFSQGSNHIQQANSGAQKVQNTANKVQQKAEQAMNTPVIKAAGAFVGANAKLAQATTKVASPMVNKAVSDIARTAKETMSLSGTGKSNANSNYYYDELDNRRNKTRQTANSYEPRQNNQRERTDARIRRTSRPR